VAAIVVEEEAKLFAEIDERDRALFKKLFWARRDPTPGTARNECRENYEARVVIVNERLGRDDRGGASSDMVKIFLLFGAPSEQKQWTAPANLNRGDPVDVTSEQEDLGQGIREYWARENDRQGNEFFRSANAQIIWNYWRNAWLAIPDGLSVRFRPGGEMVESEELAGQIERTKSRLIANPSIGYARDSSARLIDIATDLSPVETILRNLQETEQNIDDIPLEIQLAFFKTSGGAIYVPILFEFGEEVFGEEATVFGVARNTSGSTVSAFEEQMTGAQTYYEVPIEISPGEYKFYLGILDHETSRVGAQIITVEAPNLHSDGLLLSTVLLYSRAEQTDTPAGTPGHAFQFGQTHFTPKLDRLYRKSDSLGFFYYVYGLASDGEGSERRATAMYTLFKEGVKQAQTHDAPLGVFGDHAVGSQEIRLGDFEPGAYSLQVRVTDRVSGEVLTHDVEFSITDEEN